MKKTCPYCTDEEEIRSGIRKPVKKTGRYQRSCDGQHVQCYRCSSCSKNFSSATSNACFRQWKRHLNYEIYKWIASGVSQRQLARNLCIDRKTVARKIAFLAQIAREYTDWFLREFVAPAYVLEFDDMETFEHTKCQPLAITLAVTSKSRYVLGAAVSQIPCKGPLATLSREKYGPRKDLRPEARARLFKSIRPYIAEGAVIKSDRDPQYPAAVRAAFPMSEHIQYKGRKPRGQGYGELKKGLFDPLFSLNHTAASLRDRAKCLIRKTWCTSKKAECLQDRVDLIIRFHNQLIFLNTEKKAGRKRKPPQKRRFLDEAEKMGPV